MDFAHPRPPALLKLERSHDPAVERFLAPERRAFRRAGAIAIEIADAGRFSMLRDAWNDLTLRACEPNPFMDPDLVTAAAAGDGARAVPVLLAWRGDGLVGAWAFDRASARWGQPVTVLAAPIRNLMPNGTPVIDRDYVAPVLAAMLDAIARARGLPKLLSIDMINDGPVMSELQRVLAARSSRPVVLWRSTRPMLSRKMEPATYFAQIMSGGRRRKLGQLRRKLSGRGELTLNVHRDRRAAMTAAERFIKLEAAGWKAKSGASERARARYRDFVRNAVASLADHGGVEVWELSLVGTAISMALILRHLSGVYDWKIAYDERQHDCSPGVLLAQDYTTAFLSDPKVAFADSCAANDSGVLGTLWDGRQPIVNLIVDARVGGSLAFTLWAAFELSSRKLWHITGDVIHALRRRLQRPQQPVAAGTAAER